MKLISWNVNGLRAVIKKGFNEFIDEHKPDILCLQEIKATPDQVEVDLPLLPNQNWHPAEKKGYSGTAVFSSIKPISVNTGIDIPGFDTEGRVQTLEFPAFFLVNVYTPNSQRGLTRLDYRYREWDPAFLAYLKKLEKRKPVVFCGDLNVAHKEIDLANPSTNRFNAGFTDQEREGFDNLLKKGFIDTFREFEKEGGHYTWWSYMNNAREKNIGWRIDYFLISPSLRSNLKGSGILPLVMGSDHAPVVLELDI